MTDYGNYVADGDGYRIFVNPSLVSSGIPVGADSPLYAKVKAYADANPDKLVTYTTQAQREKLKRDIGSLKAKLANTDYILTKIKEAEALGKDTSEIVSKYQATLEERESWRTRINEIEDEIAALG